MGGCITSAAWVTGCGDSLSPTFQANRQSKSITVRQEYGGLRIGNWAPLWNWPALCAFLVFVGLSCSLRIRAVPAFNVCA